MWARNHLGPHQHISDRQWLVLEFELTLIRLVCPVSKNLGYGVTSFKLPVFADGGYRMQIDQKHVFLADPLTVFNGMDEGFVLHIDLVSHVVARRDMPFLSRFEVRVERLYHESDIAFVNHVFCWNPFRHALRCFLVDVDGFVTR